MTRATAFLLSFSLGCAFISLPIGLYMTNIVHAGEHASVFGSSSDRIVFAVCVAAPVLAGVVGALGVRR